MYNCHIISWCDRKDHVEVGVCRPWFAHAGGDVPSFEVAAIYLQLDLFLPSQAGQCPLERDLPSERLERLSIEVHQTECKWAVGTQQIG